MKTEELIKAKKYIEHVIGTIKHDGHLGTIQTDLNTNRVFQGEHKKEP